MVCEAEEVVEMYFSQQTQPINERENFTSILHPFQRTIAHLRVGVVSLLQELGILYLVAYN